MSDTATIAPRPGGLVPGLAGGRGGPAGGPAGQSDPVAVFHANRVQACTAAARAEGVHVGQRRRDAQSRCPELLVAQVDPDRDGRLFEPVAAAVEADRARAWRSCGRAWWRAPARGPGRYFGSEIAAAEQDRRRRRGAGRGVPGRYRRSSWRSRCWPRTAARIVPPGESAAFCAPLPITELARDPAIAPPERAALTDLLIRLGITTCGAFAALPDEQGGDPVRRRRACRPIGWRRGLAERGLSRRQIPEDLAVEQVCDPPLDRVDTAAFAARALAERFHARLADAGLACTRLAITAVTERDARLTRVWRCAAPADRRRHRRSAALAARRLAHRRPRPARPGRRSTTGAGPGAITLLRLEPVEAIGAGRIQFGLWGSDGQDDQRAGWAFARVQGLLGPESVLAPVLSGGRGPADRITLVPWGDEKVSAARSGRTLAGALPAPSPARLPTDTDARPSRCGARRRRAARCA